MSSRSLVYSNIRVYRLVMNLLYKGRYERRFESIFDLLGDDTTSVCELCFGDTRVAERCKGRNVEWTGVDLNPSFCEHARNQGFHVLEGDVFELDLPRADVYVMAGSLYHFHDRLSALADRVFERTRRWVVSEPVRNLSQSGGLLGKLARRSANPGTGDSPFRYDAVSLGAVLGRQAQRLGLDLYVRSGRRAVDRDAVVELIREGG